MLTHLRPWLAVALVELSVAAASAAVPATTWQPAAEQGAAGPDEQEEVLYAAPTTRDRIGRIMAPVYINGRGPYYFVVDSGASRSAITPRVVAELGLVPNPAERLILRGVTGSAEVPSILIERLQAGDVVLANQQLPVVTTDVFADADGILGIEGFERMCLHVDFARNHISITRDGCPRMRQGWLRISASLRLDRLVRVGATIGGHRVHAIIDTGAERSLGNLALLRALSLERRADDPTRDTHVIGATSHMVEGNLLAVGTLHLGGVGIRHMWVAFGNFNVFELWELQAEPAIVIGMDVLGTVDSLAIDYSRAKLYILPKGASNQPPTGSRIN